MSPFYQTRFGTFLRLQFAEVFTKSSQRRFLLLALGFVLASTRHTIATYLWRAGATAFGHFTRYYVFLGGPCYDKLDWLWGSIIQLAERYVPQDEVLHTRFDDTTCKKTGPKIEPTGRYRNGCGTARQEWRTLYGINFVIGELLIRLSPWPGEFVSVPIGLEVYVKQAKADALGLPYCSRSRLARRLLDRVVAVVAPTRRIRSVQDGGYATKEFLRDLPAPVEVVSRLPRNSPLYAPPPPPCPGRRGRKPRKGHRLGTPVTLAEADTGWQAHPSEVGAEIRVVDGIWDSVLPGRRLQVVLVRRLHLREAASKRQCQHWIEAFFTTEAALSAAEILDAYAGRWSIEILLHEARESFGLGQDRCRRYRSVVAINAFRMILAAAEVLWFAGEVEQVEALELCTYRPWYRTKEAPSLFDIHWAVREHLYGAGIYPKVGFGETMAEFTGYSSGALPRAA